LTTLRPTWLSAYIPELQGLRGIAVLAVFFFHCCPRLVGLPIHNASKWGWAGVNLFFVLSGFLITSILFEARDKPHYFRNFYGRRALRIWPVYVLMLVVVYLTSPLFIGPSIMQAVKSAPWLVYLFMVQNLFRIALPPALLPTWTLAIEEQYYFLWAPLVLLLRRPWILATILFTALVASPLLHLAHWGWITPLHTLLNLDGIALGSLIALGLYTLSISRRTWLVIGLCACATGLTLAATVAGGTIFLNSALATCFAGIVLTMIASSGARNPINMLLSRGPLPFYGRISYGMYMTHIMVFIFLGFFDARMNHYDIKGNLAVVLARLMATTAVATALWYGFESQILKLKRYF
jgi:peptidoglycan/LPS O-acetylase OafA/YrhL